MQKNRLYRFQFYLLTACNSEKIPSWPSSINILHWNSLCSFLRPQTLHFYNFSYCRLCLQYLNCIIILWPDRSTPTLHVFRRWQTLRCTRPQFQEHVKGAGSIICHLSSPHITSGHPSPTQNKPRSVSSELCAGRRHNRGGAGRRGDLESWTLFYKPRG